MSVQFQVSLGVISSIWLRYGEAIISMVTNVVEMAKLVERDILVKRHKILF